MRGIANRTHIARAQILEDLIQNPACRLPGGPFGIGAKQVSFRDHFEDGSDILRHPAVHQNQAVMRQQPPAADAEFRIAFNRHHAFNQLDPRPHPA